MRRQRIKKNTTLPLDKLYNYVCTILSWTDGDTLVVAIDVGFETCVTKTVRVNGINCPESRSKNLVEKAKGKAAKEFAVGLAPIGSEVLCKTYMASKEEEKFGRWLANVTLPDGRNFGKVMIDSGHAVEYHGGKR